MVVVTVVVVVVVLVEAVVVPEQVSGFFGGGGGGASRGRVALPDGVLDTETAGLISTVSRAARAAGDTDAVPLEEEAARGRLDVLARCAKPSGFAGGGGFPLRTRGFGSTTMTSGAVVSHVLCV